MRGGHPYQWSNIYSQLLGTRKNNGISVVASPEILDPSSLIVRGRALACYGSSVCTYLPCMCCESRKYWQVGGLTLDRQCRQKPPGYESTAQPTIFTAIHHNTQLTTPNFSTGSHTGNCYQCMCMCTSCHSSSYVAMLVGGGTQLDIRWPLK